jgi:hypothetical protein
MILFIHHRRSRRHSAEQIRQLAAVNAHVAVSIKGSGTFGFQSPAQQLTSALRTASLRTKLTQLLAQSADLAHAI